MIGYGLVLVAVAAVLAGVWLLRRRSEKRRRRRGSGRNLQIDIMTRD